MSTGSQSLRSESKYTDEQYEEASAYIIESINSKNSGVSKEDFYKGNIIDFSDVSWDDMRAVENEVLRFGKENGCYAALPLFEKGAFIDTSERRFSTWEVLEVNEDFYRLKLCHYPVFHSFQQIEDGVPLHKYDWFMASSVTMKVKLLNEEERENILFMNPAVIERMSRLEKNSQAGLMYAADIAMQIKHNDGLVGGIIENYENYLPDVVKKLRKKGKYVRPDGTFIDAGLIREVLDCVDDTSGYALKTHLFTSVGPLVEAFAYINYMLSTGISCKTLRSISGLPSSYELNEGSDLRRERHFNKIKVVSEKKPRAITKENVVRVYKTLTWLRRSHIRHLPSGKVVPVRSAVCKRKETEDKTVDPTVIFKA